MNIENIPVELGQTVFFRAVSKWHPAKIITIHQVGVVELEIATGTGGKRRIRRQKFAVKDLRRSEPKEEVAK